MLSTTDDLRINEIKELSTPYQVMREIPRTLTATRVVLAARNAIHAILNGYVDPPPAGFQLPEGKHYNKYFPGHAIGMPPPLTDGQI